MIIEQPGNARLLFLYIIEGNDYINIFSYLYCIFFQRNY